MPRGQVAVCHLYRKETCGLTCVPGVGCVAAAKLALEVEEVPDGDDATSGQLPGGEGVVEEVVVEE